MTLHTLHATEEVQRVRGILAELSERGDRLMSREAHLDVLLAFDHLERSGLDAWPPPPSAMGISDVRAALHEAVRAMTAILGDVTAHRVLSMPIGFAAHYLDDAVRETP